MEGGGKESLVTDEAHKKIKNLLAVLLLVFSVGLLVDELCGLTLASSQGRWVVGIFLGFHLDIIITVLDLEGTGILGLFRNRHF